MYIILDSTPAFQLFQSLLLHNYMVAFNNKFVWNIILKYTM